ncbi:MAG TPA: GNAT family N-acetyltransferase [Acidobacteriaceae bacterium]
MQSIRAGEKVRELETPRLFLQPLVLEDAVQAQPLFAQWEVVRYLNDRVPWPYPEDGVATYYRDVALPAMERGEAWHWTLRLKDEPERLIGAVSLMRGEREENRGFWLAPERRGQGLMTEAVIAVNDFWFEDLGFSVLRAPKAIENAASRRISEKTGMRVVERSVRNYVSGRHATETWEITRDEWRAWRAAHSSL